MIDGAYEEVFCSNGFMTSNEVSAPTHAGSDPVQWLDRYGHTLFAYACSRLRDPGAAEDAVQETLLAGLRNRHQFAGASSELTWLIAILRRKLIDHLRKGKQPGTADQGPAPSDFFDSKGHWALPPSKWTGGPDDSLESADLRAVFHQCFGKLPAGPAQAFWLREMEELAAEEVCKVLGITPTNLWTQLHRARLLLRKCLETNWFQTPGGKT